MSRHRGRRRRDADTFALTDLAAAPPRVLASVLQALPVGLGRGRLDVLGPAPPFDRSRVPAGQVLLVSGRADLAGSLTRLGFAVEHLRTTFRWHGETGVPAVVLLDMRDPDHAVAALEQIRAVSAAVPVVALASATDDWLAIGEYPGVWLLRATAPTDSIAAMLCDAVTGPAKPDEIRLPERTEPLAAAAPPAADPRPAAIEASPAASPLPEAVEPSANAADPPAVYPQPSIFDEPAYQELMGSRAESDDTNWFFESGPAGR